MSTAEPVVLPQETTTSLLRNAGLDDDDDLILLTAPQNAPVHMLQFGGGTGLDGSLSPPTGAHLATHNNNNSDNKSPLVPAVPQHNVGIALGLGASVGMASSPLMGLEVGASAGTPIPSPTAAATSAQAAAAAVGCNNLFVANISNDIDDDLLVRTFEPFGEILSAKVMLDIHTGRSRGFGFVMYASDVSGAAALQALHNTPLGERRQRISVTKAQTSGQSAITDTTKLYVRNVPLHLGESTLREHFGQFGVVKRFARKEDTAGRSEASRQAMLKQALPAAMVIFLEYNTSKEAQEAVRLLHGKKPWPGMSIPLLAKTAETTENRNVRRERQRQKVDDKGSSPAAMGGGHAANSNTNTHRHQPHHQPLMINTTAAASSPTAAMGGNHSLQAMAAAMGAMVGGGHHVASNGGSPHGMVMHGQHTATMHQQGMHMGGGGGGSANANPPSHVIVHTMNAFTPSASMMGASTEMPLPHYVDHHHGGAGGNGVGSAFIGGGYGQMYGGGVPSPRNGNAVGNGSGVGHFPQALNQQQLNAAAHGHGMSPSGGDMFVGGGHTPPMGGMVMHNNLSVNTNNNAMGGSSLHPPAAMGMGAVGHTMPPSMHHQHQQGGVAGGYIPSPTNASHNGQSFGASGVGVFPSPPMAQQQLAGGPNGHSALLGSASLPYSVHTNYGGSSVHSTMASSSPAALPFGVSNNNTNNKSANTAPPMYMVGQLASSPAVLTPTHAQQQQQQQQQQQGGGYGSNSNINTNGSTGGGYSPLRPGFSSGNASMSQSQEGGQMLAAMAMGSGHNGHGAPVHLGGGHGHFQQHLQQQQLPPPQYNARPLGIHQQQPQNVPPYPGLPPYSPQTF